MNTDLIKAIIKRLLLILSCLAVYYMIGGFVSLEWDVIKWEPPGRYFLIIATLSTVGLIELLKE